MDANRINPLEIASYITKNKPNLNTSHMDGCKFLYHGHETLSNNLFHPWKFMWVGLCQHHHRCGNLTFKQEGKLAFIAIMFLHNLVLILIFTLYLSQLAFKTITYEYHNENKLWWYMEAIAWCWLEYCHCWMKTEVIIIVRLWPKVMSTIT
jgi:hypothetical protein